MSASKTLFYFSLSFIAGIFIASFLYFKTIILYAILLIVFLAVLLFHHPEFISGAFCIFFVLLGIWRYQIAETEFLENELRKVAILGKEVTIIGLVLDEPDIRENYLRLTVKADYISLQENDNNFISAQGKVLVTTHRYPEYEYGDRVKIRGKLELPFVSDDFNYQNFLKKQGVYAQTRWPRIEIIDKHQGSFVRENILILKQKLRDKLYSSLSPPQSDLLAAIILGDKRHLSEDLKNKLNTTGVRHITAISGLHITVLTVILVNFFLILGFWRKTALWFAIVLTLLFIMITGFQPSAIRAGIMGGLFLLAQLLGRNSLSSRTIVFAAAVMLLYNPFLLRLDIGFQLSFLAMLGIIYLLPTFQYWLSFIPSRSIRDILAMTLSAYVFTLPLLVYNFGYISLVAVSANLLIVPVLYPVMILGLGGSFLSFVFQPLGQLLFWCVWIILTYIITVIDLLSKLPLAYITFENVHWVWLVLLYPFLTLIAVKLHRKQRLRFLNY